MGLATNITAPHAAYSNIASNWRRFNLLVEVSQQHWASLRCCQQCRCQHTPLSSPFTATKWNRTIDNSHPGRSNARLSSWKFPVYFPQVSHLCWAASHCSQKGKSLLINMWEQAAAKVAPRHWLTRGFGLLAWTIQIAFQHVFRQRQQRHTKAHLLIILKLSVCVLLATMAEWMREAGVLIPLEMWQILHLQTCLQG